MVSKKHPLHNLEKKRGTFLAIGMAVSLFFVLTAMEWTTSTTYVPWDPPIPPSEDSTDTPIVIIETKKPKTPKPPPPSPTPPRPDSIVMDTVFIDDTTTRVVIPDSILYPPCDDCDDDTADTGGTEIIFVRSEKMPVFGKGVADLLRYLAKNIKYPSMARQAGITGIVYVAFVVNKKGEVVDVKILKGIGAGCDKEAIRVVENMPKWKPGKQRGKRVSVKYTLPIRFELR